MLDHAKEIDIATIPGCDRRTANGRLKPSCNTALTGLARGTCGADSVLTRLGG